MYVFSGNLIDRCKSKLVNLKDIRELSRELKTLITNPQEETYIRVSPTESTRDQGRAG